MYIRMHLLHARVAIAGSSQTCINALRYVCFCFFSPPAYLSLVSGMPILCNVSGAVCCERVSGCLLHSGNNGEWAANDGLLIELFLLSEVDQEERSRISFWGGVRSC